ncbi:hypothetical protein B0H66DRAFT_306120 [Apodospora peruviana]|uniref:Uncharacterized protein n=1 Tax=Apodospora peruviana TaxID=516989 RepID=A0AAE0I396_9PEZI|nr:hypothetical protein B0H66DRAFT_306120 [Apodospora peruviana]
MWSPLGDEPLDAASWRPEPPGRGTWSILSTCLITLSLCIWTVSHLNIPEHGKRGKQVWRKTIWLLLGLVAPETIAWIAYLQRQDQIHLRREIYDVLGDSLPGGENKQRRWFGSWAVVWPKSRPVRSTEIELERANRSGDIRSPRQRRQERASRSGDIHPLRKRRQHAWTAAHGFFALMGGFALDISSQRDALPVPQDLTRLVFTARGLEFIARLRPDMLPDISGEQLQDKSKADYFAKSLICIQASYFCIHFINGLSLGLAVTLLEMNTFAHAFCALGIYLIWWNKPLDVNEPILVALEDDDAISICAAMYLTSSIGQDVLIERNDEGSLHNDVLFTKLIPRPLNETTHYFDDPTTSSPIVAYRLPSSTRSQNGLGFRLKDKLQGTHLFVTVTRERLLLRRTASLTGNGRAVLTDSCDRDDWVVERIRNWGPRHYHGDSELPFILLILATTIYGGWHLLAWNSPFPSYTQEILWRISGLGAAASGPALCFMIWLLSSSGLAYPHRDDVGTTSWHHNQLFRFVVWCLRFFGLEVMTGLILLLVFSRCYLVVGSLLSLPYTPNSAFETPSWSLYFPHIG